MSFKDLSIKRSYISYGDENIADSLIKPALKFTKNYKRSVGFFSSGVLETILPGVVSLARNGGSIQLITSPKLNEDDIEAINIGYAKREELLNNSVSLDFEDAIENLSDEMLQLLAELVAREILDIKIATTEQIGDYHDKLGILEDCYGNVISFFGSANSSLNGYKNNYERIRVARSWFSGEVDVVQDEQKEFDDLWNNKNPFLNVYEFKESASKKILQVQENRKKITKSHDSIELRPYQDEAINAWVKNNYHGFYTMATGTGKTWTAIYSAKKFLEKRKATIVICAPYKHLIKQWAEDVKKAFPKAKIIMVSSENAKWENQLNEEIIRNRYNSDNQIIVISTIKSFYGERFEKTINKYVGDKLLIVDEAHRFTNRPDTLKNSYSYLLGLSATPYSGRSKESGNELMNFFGGCVCNLPIEDVIGKYLVNYNYYPIFISANETDEAQFKYYSAKMAACFHNGVLIDPEGLSLNLRNRLRVISMSEAKMANIDYILQNVKEQDHVIVYCGDGKLFDNNTQRELRHIQFIKSVLDRHGYKPSQFTATENMYKRMELVDAFNKGEISALAAIRCLDEGINIPSIKSALILSSNNDYREFVQRRGRILRTYRDKQYANIYDVILLPSRDTPGMAQIELRRYLEYSYLALNKDSLLEQLNELLSYYSFSREDIAMFDEEMEEPLDE